ncbi:hypothetical protein QAD02_018563 [Eretmocerus hayati]|uniref:Uncharacterized protein n=1 Tax=Eretmocerus hayati TaxID=131215 RepID=A0ACC2PIB9_9HYME|nr:hypothetical protein QAD02_018563 [Eretmocerus hayati]
MDESLPLLQNWANNTSSGVGYISRRRRRGHRWRRHCAYIPQRWVFAIMGFLALVNAYAMRVCLSITITEMTAPLNKSEHLDNTCPVQPSDKSGGKVSGNGTFQWDEETQGYILSSFYWGYVVTHLPGGILAERYGGKYSLGLGILSTAIFTLLTPWAVLWGDAKALIVLRVLMGLGEGTTFPALNALLAQWTPPEERSRIGSLVFAGAQLGTVFSTMISGLILHYSESGWPTVFYVWGGIGVLWFLAWVVLCYNNPREHPFISEREAKYLHERMGAYTSDKGVGPIPWKYILTSAPVWALVAAQVGHDWGIFTMITDLPKYMSDVLKFSIKDNGYYSSLPYLCMWFCSLFTSWLADWAIVKGYMSTTNVRKLGTSIASIGPGLFIIFASYAGCDRMLVVACFTIGMTLMGTFYPGMKVNALDLSGNYSGTLMAMTNGIGAFTGMITPWIVGKLAPNQTLGEWQLVFWIVFAVFIVTNAIFVIWGSGEMQPWNDPEFVKAQQKIDRKASAAASTTPSNGYANGGYQNGV